MKENLVRLTVAFVFLLAASVSDLKTKKIPLWIPAALFCAAAAANPLFQFRRTGRELLAGAVPGAILLLLSPATGRKVGEGDGICLLACGAMTGFAQAVIIAETALAMAGAAGAAAVLTGRRKADDRIAFVPFLAAGTALLMAAEAAGIF